MYTGRNYMRTHKPHDYAAEKYKSNIFFQDSKVIMTFILFIRWMSNIEKWLPHLRANRMTLATSLPVGCYLLLPFIINYSAQTTILILFSH